MQSAGSAEGRDQPAPCALLHQGALQNTAASVGHTKRADSAIFPSEIQIYFFPRYPRPLSFKEKEKLLYKKTPVMLSSSIVQYHLGIQMLKEHESAF